MERRNKGPTSSSNFRTRTIRFSVCFQSVTIYPMQDWIHRNEIDSRQFSRLIPYVRFIPHTWFKHVRYGRVNEILLLIQL